MSEIKSHLKTPFVQETDGVFTLQAFESSLVHARLSSTHSFFCFSSQLLTVSLICSGLLTLKK